VFFLAEKTMETKQAALKIFEKYYSEWESDKSRMNNGYSYESTFVQMIRQVAMEVLQVSTGKIPKGKNGKKKSKRV
jgi:hypothetical protein